MNCQFKANAFTANLTLMSQQQSRDILSQQSIQDITDDLDEILYLINDRLRHLKMTQADCKKQQKTAKKCFSLFSPKMPILA